MVKAIIALSIAVGTALYIFSLAIRIWDSSLLIIDKVSLCLFITIICSAIMRQELAIVKDYLERKKDD